MFSRSLCIAVSFFLWGWGTSAQFNVTSNATESSDISTSIANPSNSSTSESPPLSTVFYPDGEPGVTAYFGNASPEASSCEAQWDSWVSASFYYGNAHPYNTTTTEWYSDSISLVDDSQRRVTTLCDGHPRFLDPEFITFGPSYSVYPTTAYGEYPEPKPSCSIGSDDCSILTTSYLSARSMWDEWKYGSTRNITGSPVYPSTKEFWPSWKGRSWLFSDAPGCTQAPSLTESCGTRCRVDADHVRLLYFPVTVVGGLCGNRSTITATPTIPGSPNTVEVNGTTYTSGYAYLSFNAVSAHSWDGKYAAWDCGEVRTNVLLQLKSEEVSSIGKYKQHHITGGPYPFNFGDLDNGPQPFSVFEHHWQTFCGPDLGDRCFYDMETTTVTDTDCLKNQEEWCKSFTAPFSEEWLPSLDIPSRITEVDPLWRTCEPDFDGVEDPPLALGSASQLSPVTTTYDPPLITGEFAHWDPSESSLVGPIPKETPKPPVPPVTQLPADPGSPAPTARPGGGVPGGNNPPPSGPGGSGGNPNRPAGLEDNSPGGAVGNLIASLLGQGNRNGGGSLGAANVPANGFPHGVVDLGSGGGGSGGGGGGGSGRIGDMIASVLGMKNGVDGYFQNLGAEFMAGGTKVTAIWKDGKWVIGDKTFAPGSIITIDGVTVSVGPNGFVVGGKTVSASRMPASAGVGPHSFAGLAAGAATPTSVSSLKGQPTAVDGGSGGQNGLQSTNANTSNGLKIVDGVRWWVHMMVIGMGLVAGL